MSSIHEALKKAHREGDERYLKYGWIRSLEGEEKRSFLARASVWISLISIVIFIGFASYSSTGLGSSYTRASSENPDKKPPLPIERVSKSGARDLFDRGMAFQKSGRLEDARRLYVETLRIDPRYVKALNNLGVIYLYARDYQAARVNFEKAIQLKPGYVDPYYNLACLFALKGEVSQSIAHLKRAVVLDQSVQDWARRDTDLRNLWGGPGFQSLIKKSGYPLDSSDLKM